MNWKIPALLAIIMLLGASAACAGALHEGLFRIAYPEGEERTAAVTLAAMQDFLDQWGDRLDPGTAPIIVHICATQRDFAARAGFSPPPKVGGVAHAEDGIIVLRTPGQLPNPRYYEGVARHELVHVLLARNTDTNRLPRWLNEGIAMHISGEYRWSSSFHVARMYMADSLFTYDDLMLNFSLIQREQPFGDLYAQSLSMTAYLYNYLGEDTFWEMVFALREKDFPTAFAQHAGMTPPEFWEVWRRSLWKVAVISSVVSGFGVFQFMALLAIVAYLRKRQRNRRTLAAWDKEDEEDEPFMTVRDLERDSEYPWEQDEGERL